MKNLYKISLFILLLPLCSFIAAPSALAFPAYQTAILPSLDTANYQEPAVLKLMDEKIATNFKFPYYERIEKKQITGAIEKITIKTVHYNEETLRQLSKLLSADIVVGVELVHAQCYVISSPFYVDTSYADQNVEVKAYLYSAMDNRYQTFTFSESGIKPVTVDISVEKSVERLLNTLNEKLPYQRIPNKPKAEEPAIN